MTGGRRFGTCCLPVSSPEVSDYRCVDSRVKVDGTDGLLEDICTPVETQDFFIRLCRRALASFPY